MINFKYFALLTILSLIIQCKHDSDVGPEKNSHHTKYITSLHNGIENRKRELIYTNDKLTQVISMHNDNGEWENEEITNIEYQNNLIISTNKKYINGEYSNDGFWYLSDKRIYLYDTNGFLYKIIGEDGDETNYTYEEGHGNAELFYNIPLLKTIGYPSIKGSMLEKHKSDCSFLF